MLELSDKTGEKDQSGISAPQRQGQDGVMPPIEMMARDKEEAVDLAGQKWKRFNHLMLAHTAQLHAEASHNDRWGAITRVSIIILSASVTVISAVVGDNQRYIVTILGGVLTVLAGIEAYFRFNRRESEAKRQQREVEALRFKLRHQWVTTVQMETLLERRFDAATKFLLEGQESYNVILNNYTFKPEVEDPVQQNHEAAI